MLQLKDGMMNLLRKRRALEEQQRRRNTSSTYTTPLTKANAHDDYKEFLLKFYKEIYDQSTRAKHQHILKEYANSLAVHYESLVPDHVSYEDFWLRYEYRCGDLNRITLELQREEEEKKKQELKRQLASSTEPPAKKIEQKMEEEAKQLDAMIKTARNDSLENAAVGKDEVASPMKKLWNQITKGPQEEKPAINATAAEDISSASIPANRLPMQADDPPMVPTRAQSPVVPPPSPPKKEAHTPAGPVIDKSSDGSSKSSPRSSSKESWLYFGAGTLAVGLLAVAFAMTQPFFYNVVCFPIGPFHANEQDDLFNQNSWLHPALDAFCPISTLKVSNKGRRIQFWVEEDLKFDIKNAQAMYVSWDGIHVATNEKGKGGEHALFSF